MGAAVPAACPGGLSAGRWAPLAPGHSAGGCLSGAGSACRAPGWGSPPRFLPQPGLGAGGGAAGVPQRTGGWLGQEAGLENVKVFVMERVKPLTRMLRQRRREVWLPPLGPMLRSILLLAPSASLGRDGGGGGGGCRPSATPLREGPCPGGGSKPPGLRATCPPAGHWAQPCEPQPITAPCWGLAMEVLWAMGSVPGVSRGSRGWPWGSRFGGEALGDAGKAVALRG